jgi:cell division protein FtsQ
VLNDEYSWNSLYVLLKYTFIDIKDVPFIDTMEVKMLDPQTLKIKVYEKGLLGYLYIPAIGENEYFDKDGFVVETSTRIIENVPKMEGVNCDEVVLYERLPLDSQKLREMLTLTQALKREGLEPDIIHFGLNQSPVLSYGNTEVWLGSIELLTQKVTRLTEILPNLNGVAGILHMENWTEETANIIFEKELEVPDSEEDVDVETDEETDTETDEEIDAEAGAEEDEDVPEDDAQAPEDDAQKPEGNQDGEGEDQNEDEPPQDDGADVEN